MLAVVACLFAEIRGEAAITRSFYKQLKEEKITWETVPYEENIFKGWTIEEVKNILMTEKEPPMWMTAQDDEKDMDPLALNPTLPEKFDPREKWPRCIHPIRNQGHCGSCWAHGATESLSDRFCINGKDVILSPQDLVSCDPHDKGCNGGGDITPFLYLTEPGAVSDSCFPYVSGDGHVPPCISKCVNNESFIKYRCKPGSVVIKGIVSTQQEELYNHGPLNTAFKVYRDFLTYKSGVYYHQTGEYLGGHAIKVLGWGVENKLAYWLCANSWATSWGDNGFFKIKIGDSDIMARGIGCTPSI